MPSSKRARIVTTSKTKKNRKELVKRLHANIQSACDSYAYIWVFDVQNMRNSALKEVRSKLADSRMFMGKTKLMLHALGSTPDTAYVDGLEKLAKYVSGEVGLLFTNQTTGDIERFFGGVGNLDYARAGAVAPTTFVVPRGQLTTRYGVDAGADDPLPMAIEPTLRKLGVPTRLVKGKVHLEDAPADEFGMEDDGYLVCREGDVLDSRQTAILKIFGVRMAAFKVDLKAVFDKSTGTVKEVGEMDVDDHMS